MAQIAQLDAADSDGKKKRKGKGAAAPLGETDRVHTESAFRDMMVEVKEARRKADEATGHARNRLKALQGLGKSLGYDRETIAWYLKNYARDASEIDRETRQITAFAKFMGLPIGAQLGLFDDDSTVIGELDAAAVAENLAADRIEVPGGVVTTEQAEEGGYKSAMAGMDLSDNPYPADTQPALNEFWFIGFHRGDEARLAKAATNGRARKAPAEAHA